jgi:hypothetical protein
VFFFHINLSIFFAVSSIFRMYEIKFIFVGFAHNEGTTRIEDI